MDSVEIAKLLRDKSNRRMVSAMIGIKLEIAALEIRLASFKTASDALGSDPSSNGASSWESGRDNVTALWREIAPIRNNLERVRYLMDRFDYLYVYRSDIISLVLTLEKEGRVPEVDIPPSHDLGLPLT